MADLRLEAVGDLSRVPRDAWNALAGADWSPFLEWDWLRALEEAGCVGPRTGWAPCHLLAWDGDALVGAVPLYQKGHSAGEFVFDWGWAEAAARVSVRYYPKLLAAVPFTPAAGRRLLAAPGREGVVVPLLAQALDAMAQQLGMSSVHVLFATRAEVDALAQDGWAARATLQFQWRNHGYATFDDFLSRLNAKKRAQIRRERRAVAGSGLDIEVRTGEAVDAALLQTMYRWHTATVAKWGWSDQYLNERFYQLLGEHFRARLHLVVALRRGRPIAAAFNVLKGGALWGRYWGCEEEVPFLHFEVCYYRAIEDCIARGVGLFSPGAGGEHKYHRAFVPEAQWSAHRLIDPRLAALIVPALAREVPYVLAQIEQLAGTSPLKRGPP